MFTVNYPIDDSIEIDGGLYTVNRSFDNVLRFFDLLNDEELDDITKTHLGINMLLGVSFLCPLEESRRIFDQLYEAYFVPEEEEVPLDRAGNPMPASKREKKEQSICFVHDAEAIFASFVQAYNIDLVEEQGKLHWLKFKALLNGLPDETLLARIVDIRTSRLPTGKGSAERRKEMLELKRRHALPGANVEEE